MSRLVRVCLLTAALAAISTTFAQAASAQADDTERATARSAAQQGIAAVLDGRYSEGVDLLERAESMVHAPTHLLYLARGYEKLGKLVRARETYLKLTKEELKPSAPKAFRDAQAASVSELARLEPRIPTITIKVEAANLKQVIVSEDDVPLNPGLLGIARPADPGSHTYVASAEGFEPASKTLRLREGASETIVLSPSKSASARGPSAPKASDAGTISGSASTSGGDLRTWGYVALGASVAGIGAGTYFLLKSSRDQERSDDFYDGCKKTGCSSEEQKYINHQDSIALNERRGAIVGFAAGGAVLVAGLTILFVLPHGEKETVAGVRPWVSPNSAGLAGRF